MDRKHLLTPPLLASALATGLTLAFALMPAMQTSAQQDRGTPPDAQEPAQQTTQANDEAGNAQGDQETPGEEAQGPEARPEPNQRMAGMDELPVGRVGSGDNSGGVDVSYRFYAPAPGLITVAVRAKHGDDQTIEVNNATGQQLPNARCDVDFNGVGNEHLVVLLPAPGWYEVVADPLGSGGEFWISGSFMVVEDIGVISVPEAPEPITLAHGENADATVRGNRTTEAWFNFTAPADGMVIFEAIGNGNGGDLAIERYENGDFNDYTEYTDDDRRGSLANEMMTADLRRGQTVHFKVIARSSSDCTFNARVRFVPDDLELELDAPDQPVEGAAPVPVEEAVEDVAETTEEAAAE